MCDELVAKHGQRREAHVDDNGLIRLRESLPIQRDVPTTAVARDEAHRLRPVSVRQRDAGNRGTAQGRGDPRDDLERNAVVAQGGDLFAATAEDKRIAALETDHAKPALRIGQQRFVDVALTRVRVVALPVRGAPADENAPCIPPAALEDAVSDQVVVIDHVRALQPLQGLHREQVRIARASTDERHQPRVRPGFDSGGQAFVSRRNVAFGRERSQVGVDGAIPEASPFGDVRKKRLQPFAATGQVVGQCAEVARQNAFDQLAHPPRQGRRGAAGRNRDGDGTAVDDGREQRRRARAVVDAVDEYLGVGTGTVDILVDRLVVGCRHDEQATVHVRGTKRPRGHVDVPLLA